MKKNLIYKIVFIIALFVLQKVDAQNSNQQNKNNSIEKVSSLGLQKATVDSDGDGIPDNCDLDDDNDGILDVNEVSCDVSLSPTVRVGYIPDSRDNLTSDRGYTFDGSHMKNSSVLKLLNAANFGPSGTAKFKFELVPMTGTITKSSITGLNLNAIFIGGIDNPTAGISYLSTAELDAIKDWSDDQPANFVVSTQVSTKSYGSTITSGNANPDSPTSFGAGTEIFNGPFGMVTSFNQGGSYQAYFATLNNSCATKAVAKDSSNRTVMYIDGDYNDLLISDVDILTDLGGVTNGASVTSNNDKLFANIWAFVAKQSLCVDADTDLDGIVDRLDLDSDGDGCPDAAEGGGKFAVTSLVVSSGTISAQSVNKNFGVGVDSNGIPTTVGAQGQSEGSSQNASINGCICYNDPYTGGIKEDTKHGITLLKRAGSGNTDNWPMIRKGAFTVLESNTKGFVITRAKTSEINAIKTGGHAVEGMMIYDTDLKCLKLYDGTNWSCFNTPTCP
ncbi:hypothetical protein [Halpernia frigidisoli]|uniref:Uncharacterized protein n=1 Tax=Halpernia frigidisoli TaxID=1125876 RepID=A0A1I3FN58_9FLAO|nr:hypothetical protein [Halpernia frigidisoli]SFI12610.1 hypothetical protein SAMN05443292_1495 [Halpernia frigidisoli]